MHSYSNPCTHTWVDMIITKTQVGDAEHYDEGKTNLVEIMVKGLLLLHYENN